MDDHAAPETETRIAVITARADLQGVADALIAQRDEILSRWIAVASRQPFHREHPDRVVADHIPALFDALVALLGREARGVDDGTTAPMDDQAVTRAAEAHAQARFEQGLGPVAVITEFRLLRQEIARGLAASSEDDAHPVDVVGGMAIVNDGLDGAATIGLTALSDRIETLRESFLATTMHDVRQPITLLEGSLVLSERWLAQPDPDLDRVRQAVVDAHAATTELMAMIDTMSDASRVAMGALEPDLEPTSLEAVVREATDAFGAADRARLQVELDGPHLIGLWDAGLLRRVVANLVGNALKYSPDGGPVRVSIGQHGKEQAELVVADQGLGLAQDELDATFVRFSRADRVRRQGIPGLGLGLYACRGIVTAHGGTITVTSPGLSLGTTVTVLLPLLDIDAIED